MLAAARTVAAFGILLQLAGFVKLLFIADYFGANALLDAYYLGLVMPTFLTAVSAATVQTAFVPAYVTARAHGEDASARALGNLMLTWVGVSLAVVCVLLIAMRGFALPLLAQGSGAATRHALQAVFVLLMWSAPLNALADAGALLLNAEGRFAAAAFAPLSNVIVGVLVLIAFRSYGLDALVWSLLAGLLVQCLVVFAAIRVAGIRVRPQLTLAAVAPGLLGSVALPVLLSVAVGNLAPAFVQVFAARVGPGAISAMGYASRLHSSLIQAIVMSVSLVLLPQFARLITQGRDAELRATLGRLFAATLLFAAAAVVLVAAGGPPAIRLLLERGHFSAGDTALVARVWLALTVGLFSMTWYIFMFRLLQARQQAWVMLAINCVLLVANVALAVVLLRWGVAGVALSVAVTYTLIMWLCQRHIEKTLGRILSGAVTGFVVRALLVNLVAYAVAVGWGKLVVGLGPLAVLSGQFLLVALANLLLARTPPLSVPVLALLRREGRRA
jgi:putative peptidoglycan lipid II flippase